MYKKPYRGTSSPKDIVVEGRKIPLYFSHPPYMDVKQLLDSLELYELYIENPLIVNLRVFYSPGLASIINLDYAKQSLELSLDFMEQPTESKRDIMLRAMCNYLAIKYFNDTSESQPYKLLVERYSRTNKNNVLPVQARKQK